MSAPAPQEPPPAAGLQSDLQRRAFFVFFASMGLFLFLGFLKPFAGLLFVAVVLALLLHPVVELLQSRRATGPTFAAIAALLLVHVAALLPFAFVARFAIQQLAAATGGGLPDLEQFRGLVTQAEIRLHEVAGVQIDLQGQFAGAATWLSSFGGTVLQSLLRGTLVLVFQYVVVLVVTAVFLVQGRALLAVARELSPLSPATTERLFDRVARTSRAVILGSLVTAIVQAALAGVGLVLGGVERAALLTVTMCFSALVPVVGTSLVWAPCLAAAVLADRWGAAVVIGVFGGASSLIDNVLRPMFIQGAAAISPLWVFLSILGGLQVLGPVGALLGPVVLAVFRECVEIYRTEFLVRPEVEPVPAVALVPALAAPALEPGVPPEEPTAQG